jgi:beta-phosphoglucomutase-like phosphatase (HAD superfamily)
MQECLEAGVALGVATTTGRGNVEALFPNLFGPAWRTRFSSLLCAEDASTKKPHPLVYQRSLAALGIGSSEAIAIEDSPNGLQSALAASIPTLVTPSAYFLEDPFEGATLVVPDLDAPGQYKGHEFERTHLTVLQALV